MIQNPVEIKNGKKIFGRKEKTILITMAANLLLIVIRFFLANLSGSIGLKANAWHSFADLFVTSVVFIGLIAGNIAEKRQREKKSRLPFIIENLVSIFVSIFIFYMGIEILRDALDSNAEDLRYVTFTAAGAFFGVLVNYFMARYKMYVGRSEGSKSLEADGRHSKMDMYCSIAVLVGISGSLFGMKSLDKAAAIAAMILLVSAGFEILSSSVHDLRHPGEAKNGEHHHMHLNKKIILPTAGFFALAYVFSGFYIVKIDQSAIVKRFGKITKPHVESGLHYKLPFPFEEVLIIESDRIRTVNTGVQELLTGDTNLVKVATSVHYKIKSQLNYVVNIADAENLINSATLSSIRAVAGKTELDYLLTRGKEDIEKKVQKILQQKLDELKSGIEVVNVQLPLVEPPDPVKEKFNDLASARQDKSIYVHEALGYKNSILPKARGDAYTMVAEAESYKADKINTAIGDAKLFEEQVTSVKGSKSVTKFRMYMETMDKILPDVEKILLAGNVKINRAELWLKNSNKIKDGE